MAGYSRSHTGAERPAGGQIRLRDISKTLPMSLLRAREAVMQNFRPILRHFGVTEQQWRVLRALSSMPSSEILALADATCLLAPSLSKIVRGLEERGFVDRRASPEDLRRGVVSISPSGLELLARAAPHFELVHDEISRRFDVGRIAAMQQMLSELEAAASERPSIAGLLHFGAKPSDTSAARKRGRPRRELGTL